MGQPYKKRGVQRTPTQLEPRRLVLIEHYRILKLMALC